MGPGAGVGAEGGATGELLVFAANETAFLAKVRKGVLVASDCRMVWSDCWSRLLLWYVWWRYGSLQYRSIRAISWALQDYVHDRFLTVRIAETRWAVS